MDIAASMKVPCIDAYDILNGNAEKKGAYFTPRGGLRSDAFDAVNEAFLQFYRALEREVMGRKASAAEGGKDQTVSAEPGKPAADAARRPTNLVTNGGFEEMNDQTDFAKAWTPHVWGKQDTQYTVSVNRANPHEGERSLAVRLLEAGAAPGAFTTVSVSPGKYEVRYWARADVGENARVYAHLAGKDLRQNTVGDQWTQFKETVEVDAKQVNASLRLWTTTMRVRIWFDDVEVVPVN